MKNCLYAALAFLLSYQAFCATTTARPFSLNFYTPKGQIDVSAKLRQTCRYEKFVIGDSAEYHSESKNYDLTPVIDEQAGSTLIQISLEQAKTMELTGLFKPNKECMSELMIELRDSRYAIGWANQMKRPISFKLRTAPYAFERDSQLDMTEISTLLNNQLVEFDYHSVPGLQVNIWTLIDGKRVGSISPISAAIDPKTQMPFPLQK